MRPGPEARPGERPGEHVEAGREVHRDDHFDHRDGGRERYAFQGRDVRHFNDHDRALWRGGAWHHEYHNGRLGYWWFAGGAWYFYDQPVYPYPVVVSDTYYVDPVVVEAPPPPPQALAPPPPGYWYYCDNPPGYYPYIGSCATPFRTVPAQP